MAVDGALAVAAVAEATVEIVAVVAVEVVAVVTVVAAAAAIANLAGDHLSDSSEYRGEWFTMETRSARVNRNDQMQSLPHKRTMEVS